MLKDVKISVRQFAVLVIIYTIGTTILVIPSGLAVDAKQDAWLAAIIGVGLNLLVVCLYNKVGDYFTNMTLVEYNEKLFGKWVGKMLSLVFIFFSFIGAAFIIIIFLAAVIMANWLGLETIAPAGEIFFPWVMLFFFAMVIFLLPQIRLIQLKPYLGEGIMPVIRASLTLIGTPFMELIVLLMVIPFVNYDKKAIKAFLVGTAIAGFILIIITLISILAFIPKCKLFPKLRFQNMVHLRIHIWISACLYV